MTVTCIHGQDLMGVAIEAALDECEEKYPDAIFSVSAMVE